MSTPKFNISDTIRFKDEFGEYVEGYVVLIMNSTSEEREYYCSMYPGAISGYYWINCVDLCSSNLEDGRCVTLQVLNKFTEDQLEFADIRRERKEKIKKING